MSDKTPLHYRLTNQDWVNCFTQLSRAELGILFYIRTLDPFGDRPLNVNSQVLAEILDIHRTSVSRALKKLEAMGMISLEILTAKVGTQASSVHPRTDDVHPRTDDVHPRTDDVRPRTDDVHPRTIDELEPLPSKSFKVPHTNSNYTNFIQTLSKAEREKFEEFGLSKANSLPKPPQLPMKWVEKHWEEIYRQFQAEGVYASDKDWREDPHWNEYLAMMREGIPKFVALGDWHDQKTRKAIADWAIAQNLVWSK